MSKPHAIGEETSQETDRCEPHAPRNPTHAVCPSCGAITALFIGENCWVCVNGGSWTNTQKPQE